MGRDCLASSSKNAKEKVPHLELTIRFKNNSFRTVLLSTVTNRFNYEDMQLVILFDITRRKQWE